MLLAVAAASVARLPVVIVKTEKDSLLTASLDDGVDGSSLLRDTSNSNALAGTLRGPASLEDNTVLAIAKLADDVKLALDELTGLLSGSLVVEEGMGVGSEDVDDTAEGGLGLGLLPDVDGLGRGEKTGVAGELALAGLDEGGDLLGRAVAVDDSLVTDGDERDEVPLPPALEGADLLGNLATAGGAAIGAVNENTDHHLDSVLLASATNILKGVAVGGVGTDDLDTLGGEAGNILLNIFLGHAGTSLGLVRGVGRTPGNTGGVTAERTAVAASRLGLGRSGGRGSRGSVSRSRLRRRGSRGGRVDGSRRGSRGGGSS